MRIHRKKQMLLLVIIAACAGYVSDHYIQLMLIQGESMYPSYHNLQMVVLDKRDQKFQTGDVAAFQCAALDALLVKRIVAGPGDTVWITDGMLYVNGQPDNRISEYISYSGIAADPITVPEGAYFMIGDNCQDSKDSRYGEIGCVSGSCIIGKVIP